MNDRVLVPVLRLRDPRAIGATCDTYAERLYLYCWSRLHSREAAEPALLDTLIWAEAHAPELPPGMGLAPWLYGIARAECLRRQPHEAVPPDVPPGRPDQDDALARVLAWRAVTVLSPLSRELLDLRHRHGLAPADIATVVGRPVRNVTRLLDRGRALLELAVVAEILAVRGPAECAGCRQAGQDGELLHHLRDCATCRRRVPQSVSAAKVHELLPRLTPPPRSQVMRALTDPALARYRLLVAARDLAPDRGPSVIRRLWCWRGQSFQWGRSG